MADPEFHSEKDLELGREIESSDKIRKVEEKVSMIFFLFGEVPKPI